MCISKHRIDRTDTVSTKTWFSLIAARMFCYPSVCMACSKYFGIFAIYMFAFIATPKTPRLYFECMRLSKDI